MDSTNALGAAGAGWPAKPLTSGSARDVASPLATLVSPADQASADKLQAAKRALSTLQQVKSSMAHSGKDAAQQKLAWLKARLKNLMLLGGDPKSRAREAAAIAKEIANAARDYAAGGASAAPAPTPAAADTTPTEVQDPNSPPPDAQAGDGTGQPAAATVATDAQQPGQASKDQPPANGPAPSGGANDADREFIREARLLAQQAKAILEGVAHAAKRTKGPHETPSREEAAAGDQAVEAVDKAAHDLGLDGGSTATLQTAGDVAGAAISIKV